MIPVNAASDVKGLPEFTHFHFSLATGLQKYENMSKNVVFAISSIVLRKKAYLHNQRNDEILMHLVGFFTHRLPLPHQDNQARSKRPEGD